MKYLLVAVLLFFSAFDITAQSMDAKQIKQKMAEIRRNTNWDNDAEAKKANEEILKLSKMLMMSGKKNNPNQDEKIKQAEEENAENKMKMLKMVVETAGKGEGADILFAGPVRDEIVQHYKDQESEVIKSQQYLDEMEYLVIDMSLKTIQRTIDQMDKFKSIKTLIITGGNFGAPVNLSDLLNRAKKYPLEELYIINFRNFVTTLPRSLADFKNLKLLSCINNKISVIPPSVLQLHSLKTLYVDINPVKTLLPSIAGLTKLEELGIGKTKLSGKEIELIKQKIPNCKIEMQ